MTGIRLIGLLSVAIGGGSLILLGLFLVAGPFGLIDLGLRPAALLGFDAGLCLLFFLQHSGLLRRPVRRALVRWIPEELHGALYSISSGSVLLVLILCWQGPGRVIFRAGPLTALTLHAVLAVGVVGFCWAALALRSFDSLGLGELRRGSEGRPPAAPRFVVRGPYRWVRHPFYTCSLLIFWSQPVLTSDRLVFNLLFSAWVVAGALLEERDLVRTFGQPYVLYRQQVPMLIPYRRPPRGPATS